MIPELHNNEPSSKLNEANKEYTFTYDGKLFLFDGTWIYDSAMRKVSQAWFDFLWYKEGGKRVFLHWLPLKSWSGLEKGTTTRYLGFLELIENPKEREVLIDQIIPKIKLFIKSRPTPWHDDDIYDEFQELLQVIDQQSDKSSQSDIKNTPDYSTKEIAIIYFYEDILITPGNALELTQKYNPKATSSKLEQKRINNRSEIIELNEDDSSTVCRNKYDRLIKIREEFLDNPEKLKEIDVDLYTLRTNILHEHPDLVQKLVTGNYR